MAEEQQRLYRSRTDRMIAGVCGGMAEYFAVDSTLIRLLWAALVLAGGVGFLLYLAALIIIPEQPGATPHPSGGDLPPAERGPSAADRPADPPATPHPAGGRPGPEEDVRQRRRQLLGWGLILFGALLLLDRLFPGLDVLGTFWPLALVGAGIGILVARR